ncbi:MAG: hypothetical protein NTZ05_01270, partial [Chloroflexi bacterium]|nr:hypothetical protein [Chloroflexota bacterium]
LVGIVTFGLTIPGLDYNFATRVDRQLLDDILEGCKDMGCSINYAVEPSAPATPAPTPPASPGGTPGGAAIPGRVPGFIILARGEGATRESDFKFSVGKRNSGALEGWLVWAPKAGGHIQNVTLSSVDGGGGTASVWGKVPFQGAQWTFNLVANAQTATMKLHRPDGSVYATWGGQVTGGSVLVAGP